MANTTYKELADSVFRKIKDRSFCEISEDLAYEIVIGYIKPAIVAFQSATEDLANRDDELAEFGFHLSDTTFEILSNYMVIQWLTSNYILTNQSLKARLTTSDYHALGLKDMLAKAIELRADLMKENDQLAINKSYRDSKLFDLVVNRKKV